MMDEAARESMRLAKQIYPLLAGRPPEVQGAVLADLLSMWLAGHYRGGEALLERLLEHHVAAVKMILPVQIKILEERQHRKN